MPFSTPNMSRLGRRIGSSSICPKYAESLVLMSALTSMLGDAWSEFGFVRLKAITQRVPENIAFWVVLTTRIPTFWVHRPVSWKQFEVVVIGRLAVSAVCDPVIPVIVTLDPSARS